MSKKNEIIDSLHSGQVYCPLAWYSLTGQKDGKIGVCCMNSLKQNDEEIGDIKVDSFSKIWNTSSLKKLRQNMLLGKKSDYCSACYKKESMGLTSLRKKAISYYGDQTKYFLDHTSSDGDYDGPLKKIDLRLSNLCNLSCRMCSGDSSTSRYALDQKLGITYTDTYTQEPYDVENFWEDIQNWNTVSEIKVAGGEPLMNKNLYKLLQILIKKDYAKNIEITFLTNLTILPGINGYKNFLFGNYNNIFEILYSFKQTNFHVSIDGYGKSYEYIRIGSKWEPLQKNIEKVLDIRTKNSQINVEFMPTIQKDNIYDFPKLYIYAKKNNIKIDIKPLVRPEYLSIVHLGNLEKEKVRLLYDTCISKYQYLYPEICDDFNYITRYMNNHTGQDIYINEYYEKSKIMDDFMESFNSEQDIPSGISV